VVETKTLTSAGIMPGNFTQRLAGDGTVAARVKYREALCIVRPSNFDPKIHDHGRTGCLSRALDVRREREIGGRDCHGVYGLARHSAIKAIAETCRAVSSASVPPGTLLGPIHPRSRGGSH
jgi:hypothetical protein